MLDKRHRPPNRQEGDRHDRECLRSRVHSIIADGAEAQGLPAVHRSWGLPSESHLRWLLEQGVPDSALWPIGGARVQFDGGGFSLVNKIPSYRSSLTPCGAPAHRPSGLRACEREDAVPGCNAVNPPPDNPLDAGTFSITFRALDRGEVIDLIAWNPETGALASWMGAAFCLGDLDDIHNPATFFMGGALHVHADPLQWLKAGREGIVILRPEMAHALLRNCRRIMCAKYEHALQLERWMVQPRVATEILIQSDNSEETDHVR